MTNNSKDEYTNKNSLIKEITEREIIVRTYQQTGLLDRNKAISKIRELRLTNRNVAEATSIELAIGSIPFLQATDNQIIEELIMQKRILKAELIQINR